MAIFNSLRKWFNRIDVTLSFLQSIRLKLVIIIIRVIDTIMILLNNFSETKFNKLSPHTLLTLKILLR